MSDQTKKPVYINRENFTDKIKSYLRHPGSMILMFLVMLATFITFALLLFLIFYILINGIPYIKPSLFSLHYTSDNASVIPALINTVVMTLLSLLIAVPFGIFSAIFLVEYAGKGNKFIEVIRLTTETLSGIPSIVYGFFGLVVIVPAMQKIFSTSGKGILTASLLLGIMILPTIIEVTESSLRAVPTSYYEGSLALGATKERTIFKSVMVAAKSGVMSGVILGIGRAIGETMAVIMVAGNQAAIPTSVLSGVRTLTANIVLEMAYAADLHRDALIATAVVLFVFILIINVCFSLVKRRNG